MMVLRVLIDVERGTVRCMRSETGPNVKDRHSPAIKYFSNTASFSTSNSTLPLLSIEEAKGSGCFYLKCLCGRALVVLVVFPALCK